MKRITFLVLSALYILNSIQCQNIELTFTANDNLERIQLESIKVMNRTQGVDTVLYWPDTTLVLYYVGIPESPAAANGFRVTAAYPNPVKEFTTIDVFVPEKEQVNLMVTDVLGRVILMSDRVLERGSHSFRFVPGEGKLFFFSAQFRNQRSHIKILNLSSGETGSGSLQYLGSADRSAQLKSSIANQSFIFTPGDELLYIGYLDTLQSGILDSPEESQDYTFQFAYNIPCPGTPTVEYEGQTYNTIQIMSQCWLKENLNVGEIILGEESMNDNGVLEKYCYNNEPDSCYKYGGLYQWDEMMQYTTQQGVQGICPPGWHLPTDEEWKVLEGAVDSLYGIGNSLWDNWGYRGYDAGTNLKTVTGWHANGNGNDLFGFSGLPGGFRWYNTDFMDFDGAGSWWTSTETFPWRAFHRTLHGIQSGVTRYSGESVNHKGNGYSVRCLRD